MARTEWSSTGAGSPVKKSKTRDGREPSPGRILIQLFSPQTLLTNSQIDAQFEMEPGNVSQGQRKK